GHPVQEFPPPPSFLVPVDDCRYDVTSQNEIFGDRHRWDECEVLVNHAQSEGMGVLRIGDCPLSAADEDAAFGRMVITHDALDQRAFASAVFAKECVERARPHL